MFGIGNLFRAIGYLLTGKVGKAVDALRQNPAVIAGNYETIIEGKLATATTYKSAIGSMVAQEETKIGKLKELNAEIERLGKLKAGAAAKAKKIVESHGGDQEKCKADPEFVKCQAAFKDFSSTLEEKEKRADELEGDVKALTANIAKHKAGIEGLLREIDTLKTERHEAVADIVSANQEKQIADMLTGISDDKHSKELQALRDSRAKAKADARVSRELSGLDSKRSENEFLAELATSEANSEFDAMMFGEKKTSEAPAVTTETKLPEA